MDNSSYRKEIIAKTGKALLLGLTFCGVLLAIPSRESFFANGLPFDHPLDVVLAIVAFAGIFTFATPLVKNPTFALLLLLALIAGGARLASFYVGPSSGLKAYYYYETKPNYFQQVFSIFSPAADISKVESHLDLEGTTRRWNRQPLWLEFLNGQVGEFDVSKRLSKGLIVVWKGFITPERDCTITAKSSGVARVLTPTQLSAGISAQLTLEVRFSSLQSPYLRLLTTDTKDPVPSSWLTTRPSSDQERLWGTLLLWLSYFLLLNFWVIGIYSVRCLWGQFTVSWQFLGYGGLLLAALIHGAILWEHKVSKDPDYGILPGNDYLLYEIQARNILVGRENPYPFHRAPGMRSYLAVSHLVFGEDSYGIAMSQQIWRGLTAIIVKALWIGLTKRTVLGWGLSGIVLLIPQADKFSLRYWPVTLGTLLFTLFAFCFIKSEKKSEKQCDWLAATGFLGGLLTLVRTNAIAFAVSIPLWLLWKKRHQATVPIFYFLIPFLGILSSVPIHNKIVTDKWIFTATQGPINIVLGNNIPRDIKLPNVATGSPASNQRFYQGLECLLDFENNNKASFDPFQAEDNYLMQRPLMKLFRSYLYQRPAHFIGQIFRKIQMFFFPLIKARIFLYLTLIMAVSIFFLFRKAQFQSWMPLLVVLGLYIAPLLLAYFEVRHRVVVAPLMAMLAWYVTIPLGDALAQYYRRHFPHRKNFFLVFRK